MRILVSGSLAYDTIMDFPGYFADHILPDKIHVLNVSFSVDTLRVNFGGTAGNIAYNLALLGEQPVVLAAAGHDFDRYRAWLEQHGVDAAQIKIVSEETTAVAHVITDLADNQLTAFYQGAMRHASGIENAALLENAFAIVAPGNKDDMAAYPELYRKRGIPFIFDPGQAIPVLSGEELKSGMGGAEVFISNDYELRLVLDKTGLQEKELFEYVKIGVTTFGEKGSCIKTKEKTYEIPPTKPERVTDPTGAGDAYRAGLLKALVMKWPLDVAGRFASVVASYAIEHHGTQVHTFALEDVKQRYRAAYGHGIV